MVFVPSSIVSKVTLQDLTRFEAVLGLQRREAVDRSCLDTNHVLVTVLGGKVADGLHALLPRVPDHSVLQVVPDNVEAGLAVLQDRGRVLLEGLVHAVGLAGDLQLGSGRFVFCRVEDFVNVSGAGETGYFDLRDVL